MVALLRLLWGALSRFLPAAGAAVTAVGSVVSGLVAAAGAKKVMVALAIAAFILWMPMPAWLSSIPSRVSAIPPSVVYVMEYAKVAEGIAIILGAHVTRFLARLVLKAITSGG